MFVLSDSTEFEKVISDPEKWNELNIDPIKWRNIQLSEGKSIGLVILADNSILIPNINFSKEEFLFIKLVPALKRTSSDGIDIEISIQSKSLQYNINLLCCNISLYEESEQRYIEYKYPIPINFQGDIKISCNPGPKNLSDHDWLAITELLICKESEVNLARARMHNEMRMKNEIQHFTSIYKMPIYKNSKKINAFSYAQKKVQDTVIKKPIIFKHRLQEMSSDKDLKILSICTGSARIEQQLLDFNTNNNFEITLIDVNENLLKDAEKILSGPNRKIETIVADANYLDLPKGKYDIAICVSALHHIVELEKLFDNINDALHSNGEFWSIAEYIGRNGSMLWPESYVVANTIFRDLPEKYRCNHVKEAGKKIIERNLPNNDCSAVTFEGIRAQDIVPLLNNKLKMHEVNYWSTIIWRLLGPAYVNNYDLNEKTDKKYVDLIINKDIECFNGNLLKPVGMRAVYRKRI